MNYFIIYKFEKKISYVALLFQIDYFITTGDFKCWLLIGCKKPSQITKRMLTRGQHGTDIQFANLELLVMLI